MELAEAVVGNTLMVKVRPGTRRTRLVAIVDGVAHIELAAQPEDGKANAELERFVRKETGKRARIVSGRTIRRKRVLLE